MEAAAAKQDSRAEMQRGKGIFEAIMIIYECCNCGCKFIDVKCPSCKRKGPFKVLVGKHDT